MTTQRSHVPKFGNWEGENDVPYTAYFDKARKTRPGTKMINPNDPEENSDLALQSSSSADEILPKPRVHSENLSEKGLVKSTHDELQNGDPKQFVNSPARNDNLNKSAGDSVLRPGSHGVASADNRRRPSRQSTAGSEYSVERSPLHRQAKTPGRDSPSWEGKSSYDGSHGTPGRSRLRSVNREDDIPDKSAAVPKFGDWDESDPASADGYTHIFNKVREEKHVAAGHAAGTPNGRSYVIRNQPANDKAQGCCFFWSRK